MKWSLKVGQLAGTVVYVHVTFFVLLAWIGVIDGLEKGSLAAAAAAVGFTLTLFACVVLHEFGHALMARRFGIRTRDIILFPIGGVGRLERIPDVLPRSSSSHSPGPRSVSALPQRCSPRCGWRAQFCSSRSSRRGTCHLPNG